MTMTTGWPATGRRVERLPLVSGLAWLDVVDAAGGRCECAGWCGHRHRGDGSGRAGRRCERENTSTAPLHVIRPSADTGLVAVCAGCHDRWAAVAEAGAVGEPGAGELAVGELAAGLGAGVGR